MANSYSLGSVFGIPVRVHVTLLIFLPLFALSFAPVAGLAGLFYGALGAVGLFGSVVLHEVGHSLVARAKGSRILEILLLPIGGMARLNQLPKRPADEIQTALAGPARRRRRRPRAPLSPARHRGGGRCRSKPRRQRRRWRACAHPRARHCGR